MKRCETCDERVPHVNEYGICTRCYQWEIEQGWHSDDDGEPLTEVGPEAEGDPA